MQGSDVNSLTREQLEAELRRLRAQTDAAHVGAARHDAIFNSAVDFAIVTTDREGVITGWNSGAERMVGWTAAEMRNQDASRFFTPEDRAGGRVEYEMSIALRDGRASDERWHMRKDGSRFWASGEMMPLRDEAGGHLGFLKIMRDRTAGHLAGITLRDGERRCDALLGLSDQLSETDGDIAGLTDAACGIIGQTLGVQLVGFGLVNPDAETITVERDWTTGGARSLAGTLGFREFGSYIDDLKRGETVVVTDARTDPRTRAFADALEARSARAFVNTPVYEHGRFVALLYVSTGEVRDWTREELLFIREVAARARAATARQQAENALRASEAELRLVADASPFLIAFVDRTLTYRFANAGYLDWFDLPPEEVVGRTIRDITGEQGFAARRQCIEKALAGEPARMDLDWPSPDGRRRIADIRYTPRRDEGGSVDGFYIFVQDVTAMRDAAAYLADRADTLALEVANRTAVLDRSWRLSQELLVIARPDGTLEAVNPLWTVLLGWSERELVGSRFVEYTHPDDLAKTLEVLASVFEKPLSTPFEYRFRHRNGSYRWFSWTAAFEDGKVYASGRDTSLERQQADALRQSQKMEAVGQLTGGVAHDFNNLLTIIRSSVDLLRRPNLKEERRKRYMDAVSDTVDRAAKLTGQLLAFARRQALKPEILDVGERLRAVADMLDTVTGARVKVATELPSTPCFIRADLSQFETALINMAVNARDAMQGEGTLTLRLGCNHAIPAIRGHAGNAGPFARIDLSDTGSGIATDALPRIFEPFFTTKEIGKGTGLGLSQVFGFVKQSGGDVDVTSALGAGTTFTLYLPQVEADENRDKAEEESGPAPGGSGQRVLVVEDNIEVGQFATQILEDLGYETAWAANAETALARLGADGNGFEAVFSDVVMPGMGGIALARELRRRLPELPVLLSSGYSHVLAEDDAHGFELLQKPYSADQLSRVLRRVIAKKAMRVVRS